MTWLVKNVNIVITGKVITQQQKLIVIKQEDIKDTMMIVIAENTQKDNIHRKHFIVLFLLTKQRYKKRVTEKYF